MVHTLAAAAAMNRRQLLKLHTLAHSPILPFLYLFYLMLVPAVDARISRETHNHDQSLHWTGALEMELGAAWGGDNVLVWSHIIVFLALFGAATSRQQTCLESTSCVNTPTSNCYRLHFFLYLQPRVQEYL